MSVPLMENKIIHQLVFYKEEKRIIINARKNVE